MKHPAAVIESWIKTLNNDDSRLTVWELEFMESITDQFDRCASLSDKQIEILERIYAEKTR